VGYARRNRDDFYAAFLRRLASRRHWTLSAGVRYTTGRDTGSNSKLYNLGDPPRSLTDWTRLGEIDPKLGISYRLDEDILFFTLFAGLQKRRYSAATPTSRRAESYDPKSTPTSWA
jgi:hypothetical protein